MGAAIQRLWHQVSSWPFLSVLRGSTFVPEPPQIPDEIELDKIPVTFREGEDACEPTAEQIQAQEHERAEWFKRDQLLPIMGLGGGSPSPPS